MEKKSLLFAVLFCITAVTTGIGFYLWYEKNQATLTKQERIDQLTRDLQDSQQEMAEFEEQTRRLEQEKERLESMIELQNTRDVSLENGYKIQIASLQKELENAELRIKDLTQKFNQALKTSPPEINAQLQRLQAEVTERQATIDDLSAQLAAQQEKAQQLAQERTQLKQEIERLQAEVDERQATVADLTAQLASQQEETEQVAQERTRLEQEIQRLQTEITE
ncbi:hypothetical protein GF339_14485, partial [candidate division KSB3 bacterium]|nr:hypothetical protein [candidate division KSB3 bacterium]MBD3325789.1 hypothetical protein [candidate division KSB3 bacterium]